MSRLISSTAELITYLKVFGGSIEQDKNGMAEIKDIKASSAQWLIAETIAKLEEKINDADLVLSIARHCETISKQPRQDHAKEYHKIAQHLKKSAGHLKALERTINNG